MKTIQELMSLKGRRFLITGANGGIGQQISFAIAELGGDLLLVDKPNIVFGSWLDKLQELNDIDVLCKGCDLENDISRNDLISDVTESQDPLNGVINNAAFVGTSELDGWVTGFEDQTVATWRRAMEVNITSVFDLSKGLATKLKQSGHGVIINVASIYGVLGPDYSLYEGTEMGNPAAYAASKGGLIQLTRWLSTTLAPNIRVNAISPGGVFRNQPAEFVRRYESRVPLGRMAHETDIKGVVAYLVSDLSEYVTGQNILVDGGRTVW